MRIGVISDIHANLVALEAVIQDMPDVDAIVCAGDVVGYNPWPAECVEILRERNILTVQGNHDRAVATEASFSFNSMADAGAKHALETMTDEQITWLAELPTERVEFDGRLKIAHGHPDDPDRYTYPHLFGPRLLEDEDVLVLGHTHHQHYETYYGGIVMNPGSVGQPRDGDPRAAYAILDLEELTVTERRVEYDIDRVGEAVEEAGLPAEISDRLYDGR